MQCLYCGERLSLSQRHRHKVYCSSQHRDAFIRQRDQDEVDELRRGREAVYRALDADKVDVPEAESAAVDECQEPVAGEDVTEEAGVARLLAEVEAQAHYYQVVLDRLPCGIAILDGSLQLVYANRSFRRLFEGACRLEPGVPLLEICPGESTVRAAEEIQRTGEEQEAMELIGGHSVDLCLVCLTPSRKPADCEYVLSVHPVEHAEQR